MVARFVHKKTLVPFLGVEPSSVGFITCSLVTTLTVFCRLLLLSLSWFIQWKGRGRELHAV